MNLRRLTDLNPMWTADGNLIFDCPSCPYVQAVHGDPELVATHLIEVPIKRPLRDGGLLWAHAGGMEFSQVTLTPSIDFSRGERCRFHGWVTNGVVTW